MCYFGCFWDFGMRVCDIRRRFQMVSEMRLSFFEDQVAADEIQCFFGASQH